MTGYDHTVGSRQRAAWRRLRPPPPIPGTCERTAALRSLHAARLTPLTLVIAPAGFGKTTLLAQWCAQLAKQDIGVAWYAGSAGERDAAAFLDMLAQSLRAAGVDTAPLAELHGDRSPQAMLDAIILALDRRREPLVIVIDEYERVDCSAVAATVETLVQSVADTVHIVIAGRAKPRLPFAVWRLQGLVRVIEAADLTLQPADIAAIVDLDANSPEVTALVQLTEGWPVAVGLYRLWRDAIGDAATARSFTGRSEEMTDYFAQRVMATLPQPLRDMLVRLSVLDDIEASAIDHIVGGHDGAARLGDLHTHLGALFARSDIGGVATYRLHPLLRSYTFAELEMRPDVLKAVRHSAASWLWDHHYHTAAIRLWREAEAIEQALRRLGGLMVIRLFMNYGNSELRLILREMPQEIVDASPRLRMMLALVHCKEGLFGESRALLAAIRAETCDYTIDPDGDAASLTIEGLSLELLFDTYIDGAPEDCEARTARIVELAHDVPLLWAWCHNILLVVHQFRGEPARAEQELDAAAAVYAAIGMISFADHYLELHRILIAMSRGVLHQAGRTAGGIVRHALPLPARVKDPGSQPVGRMAMAIIDYYQTCRPGAADLVAAMVSRIGPGEAWIEEYAFAWPVTIDAAWRRHGCAAARAQIAAHRASTQRLGMRAAQPLLDALDAICVARAGDIELARELLAAGRLDRIAFAGRIDTGWQAQRHAQLAFAWVALHDGDSDLLRKVAGVARDHGEGMCRLVQAIEGQILHALACAMDGAMAVAQEAFQAAVKTAVPDQWLLPFTQFGDRLVPFLRDDLIAEWGAGERTLAARILEVNRASDHRADADALSEREAEVLAQIADGASNKLVARRLGISDNTVKFHLKRAYAKLGVTTRQAAVARMLQ